MKLAEFYKGNTPVISFELFPPNTEKGMLLLEERLPKLIELDPSFMTVTYGAMGSMRERTLEIASRIRNEYGEEVAHHLTCVGLRRDQITEVLTKIREHNIENIVALRGDSPRFEASVRSSEGGYDHADQLVEHIRDFGDFGIAVGGYPEKHIEASDFGSDLQNLKRKVDCGAHVVITQLFYDNEHFYAFEDRCRKMGIEQPIIPGLMPILNTAQIRRITEMCGATIPEGLLRQITEVEGNVELVQKIGIEHTVAQADDLLNHGVSGIHFYVLNQYFHIAEIVERIKPFVRGPSPRSRTATR
jgi:methylenetetrahydrofolate reductase (NADPH)